MVCTGRIHSGGQYAVYHSARHQGFYEHYQIGSDIESPETETEPKGKGELTSRYVGSHSPFGMVWQIAAATGWSVKYILWGINYQTLRMMLADAPRYEHVKNNKKGSKGPKGKPKSVAGFFQTRLQDNSEE